MTTSAMTQFHMLSKCILKNANPQFHFHKISFRKRFDILLPWLMINAWALGRKFIWNQNIKILHLQLYLIWMWIVIPYYCNCHLRCHYWTSFMESLYFWFSEKLPKISVCVCIYVEGKEKGRWFFFHDAYQTRGQKVWMIQLLPCCLEVGRCAAVFLPHEIFWHQEYEEVFSLHVALSQIFSSYNNEQPKTHYIKSAIYTFFFPSL